MRFNKQYDLAEGVEELVDTKEEFGYIREFHQDILDNILNGVWVSDRKDEIFYANKGMGRIYGIKPHEIVGRNALSGFSEATLKMFRQYYIKAKVTLKPVYYYAIPLITPAGRQSYHSGWLIPRTRNGSFDGMICTVEDITERKLADERLCRINRSLKMLNQCNETLIRAGDENALLHDICRIIVAVGEYRMTWVGYAEDDEAKSVRAVAQSGFESGYLDNLNITWEDSERGHGPAGTAIRTGKMSIAKNILNEPNFKLWRDEASARGYASSISLPLIIDNKVIGALNIYAEIPFAFDDEEAALLQKLADNLSYGIMVQRIHAHNKETEHALLESRNYWEDTFDAITDMITIHDNQYNIIRANKAAQRMLSLPDLNINKRIKCFKYYHGTEKAPGGCPSCNCMKTRESASFEIFEPHLNMYLEVRAMPRLDDNNKLTGLIHVVRDITERKRIETSHNKLLEDVIKGKIEWEMTFDTVTELIILIDRDFNIVRCNMSFAAYAGVTIDTLINRKCYEYFPPCDPEQLDHCKSLVLKGEPMTRVEINTGNGRWFYVSHRPIMDKKGEFIHSVIIASDITELKNMQGKFIESEKELKNQVEDLEKFYDMAVGRELKMKDLKKEIKKLKAQLAAYGQNSTDE